MGLWDGSSHARRVGRTIALPYRGSDAVTILVRFSDSAPPQISVVEFGLSQCLEVLSRAGQDHGLLGFQQESCEHQEHVPENDFEPVPTITLDNGVTRVPPPPPPAAKSIVLQAQKSTSLQSTLRLADDFLYRWDSDDSDPCQVYLRTTIDFVDEKTVTFLVERHNITPVCVVRDPGGAPFEDDGVTPTPTAAAVATLAQVGINVPVEISVEPCFRQTYAWTCEEWTRVNRGAGLILSADPARCDATSYAQVLLDVFCAAPIAVDRLVPLNGVVAALGSRPERLPMQLARVFTGVQRVAGDAVDCIWRDLRCHCCDAPDNGSPAGWQCLVANIIIPEILETLASEILSQRELLPIQPGHRLRVMPTQDGVTFVSEPINVEMQIAPDPARFRPTKLAGATT